MLSKTNTGRSCIEWGTNYPLFTYTTDVYTSSGLESNYCRNPGTDAPDGDTIWCYIDEQAEWEYCALPNAPTTAIISTLMHENAECKESEGYK